MILYRPVGLEELVLVFASGMKAFPPRLAEQPFFYPVLSESYAAQVAKEWNTKSDSLAGYVTRFSVTEAHAALFRPETVGSREHRELWVPAEKLEEFNRHVEGQVGLTGAFFGDNFKGVAAQQSALKGKGAVAQVVALDGILAGDSAGFFDEVVANKEAVFAHFPFWRHRSFAAEGLPEARRTALLDAIRQAWAQGVPGVPLSDV